MHANIVEINRNLGMNNKVIKNMNNLYVMSILIQEGQWHPGLYQK